MTSDCRALLRLCKKYVRGRKKQEGTRVFRNQSVSFVTRSLGATARVLRVKDHRLQSETFRMSPQHTPETVSIHCLPLMGL